MSRPRTPPDTEAEEQDHTPPPAGYVPVVQRLPEALAEEQAVQEAAAEEARIAALAEELGISVAEARAI